MECYTYMIELAGKKGTNCSFLKGQDQKRKALQQKLGRGGETQLEDEEKTFIDAIRRWL
jgi:hypothetical protein